MNLVFFTHPNFLGHQSMPRFAKMLVVGMAKRGHQVEIWSPKPAFFNLPFPKAFKKWLGYLDQYLLFPLKTRTKLKASNPNTLFVLTDHALGPWLPLVANRPHVVHCHDFLAQQSALDLIPQNPTSFTGKKYQAYIRHGYSQAKNFISVSKKTQADLHQFVNPSNINSTVVYNGLNQTFEAIEPAIARKELSAKTGLDLSNGYLLHIGGNQWYKNRTGVIEIYDAWRSISNLTLPLLLIGELPDEKLLERIEQSAYKSSIYYFNNIEDQLISAAYSGASIFLFPSLAEGFGWPIAEAMACGCPVITTNEAPMTEVAGDAGFLISKQPQNSSNIKTWAQEAAKTVEKTVNLDFAERAKVVAAGIENARRFNTDLALNQIEKIYQNILQKPTAK
ncbi:glycosyltransferase [uncultured Mucilaginibacter sp.]|uniref:glycosyltransferase n=1 Tax=uncultured Mucilaginibacter sp. TaxID=797541 RepID=UPI00261C74FE|nr:glycosyltransferase [uncultured Mucilaginibacter sp.]